MRCLWGIRGHLLKLKGMSIDFERVRFCLEISRGLKTAGGKYDEVRLLWLNQAAMELRFNPYHDPTNGRFTTGDKIDVDFSGESGIINVGSDNVALENQRYGRNKSTLVNKTYISSGEYKRKFDRATDNPEVNKTLYDSAKEALKHRSGTELEDMYWIDRITGDIIFSVTDSTEKRAVEYTERVRSIINKNSDKIIITLHTHPSSMPPSIEDFNSCFKHGYHSGFVACHNGKLFKYSSREQVNSSLYGLYIQKFLSDGFNEYNAQVKALNKIMENHDIDFEEVL